VEKEGEYAEKERKRKIRGRRRWRKGKRQRIERKIR
jgi:hypothetical protein